ncbi:hypothetical protein [Henriciella sp.]|uniref:hypothetical protein n=1 Tax=Henriciella sp. TaxID=1968823 RepID=UPI002618AC5B|nr:hypothetical protein [Henriciella sp.]
MARPAGVRNQDFEVKRRVLLQKLTDYALQDGVELPSFRQLAIAAETSEPTLRHYFSNRSGVVVAIMEYLHDISGYMRDGLSKPDNSIREGLESYHEKLMDFMRNSRLIVAHAFGIRESMSDAAAREAYLKYLLMPSADALTEKLAHTEGGPENHDTAHAAAMMLMSSSLMMILHQELLDGKKHMPIDVDWYLSLVRNWLRDGLEANPEGLDN